MTGDTAKVDDGGSFLSDLFDGADKYVGGLAGDAKDVLLKGLEEGNETARNFGDQVEKLGKEAATIAAVTGVVLGGVLLVATDAVLFDGAVVKSVRRSFR